VLDNIYLGRQPTRFGGLLDRKRQRRDAQKLLERHGIQLDLDAPVQSLSTVMQKEVEILKALALDARVLLMDEPTAWLSAREVHKLHATIRSLRASGVAIIYISHILDELFAVCDTATVLRDGRAVAECRISDISRQELVEHMIGRALGAETPGTRQARHVAPGRPVRLRCAGLSRRGAFQDIHLDLHAGEILCVTGLIGAKRTELLRAIFGSEPFDAGTLQIDGSPVRFRSPREAVAAGIALVPEDRHREGLMLDLSVADNLIMATLKRYRSGLLLARGRVQQAAARLVQSLGVRTASADAPVRSLSGGNQQKVLLGKWLDLGPRVLLLDEPTVGVDVAAKADIYALLRAERERGTGILVVSSDLEEVMTLADRIAVMALGRLVRVHDAATTTRELVMEDMGAAAA
jgi:ABC-type sugar transport system ATPase subunit